MSSGGQPPAAVRWSTWRPGFRPPKATRIGPLAWLSISSVVQHTGRPSNQLDIPDTLGSVAPGRCVIVDCLALWLTRLVDQTEGWTDPPAAVTLLDSEIARLCDALGEASARDVEVFIVTNEVGSGVVPASNSGRLFRDLLGRLNAELSAVCDEAVLLVAGRALVLPKVPEQQLWEGQA